MTVRELKIGLGASIEKDRFTGVTVNRHSSLLHGKGHDLDHIQKFAHGRVPVVLQREIVVVNWNRRRNAGIAAGSLAVKQTRAENISTISAIPSIGTFLSFAWLHDSAALHVPARNLFDLTRRNRSGFPRARFTC